MRTATILRLLAAAATWFVLRFLYFWLGAGLFVTAAPEPAGRAARLVAVGFGAEALALASAWLLWRLWPARLQRPATAEAAGSPAPALLPRVVLATLATGAIGFALGFFGPMLLDPGANQGPLLGILVTGPLGFLLGPAIAVAVSIRRTTLPGLPHAAAWLAIQFALVGGFYWTVAGASRLPALAVGLMLVSTLIAAALYAHALGRLHAPKPVVARGAVLLAGAVLVLGVSAFPPVVAPWWGAGPDAAAPLPAFAFVFDRGFDASMHVPRYTVHRAAWLMEMIVTAALIGIALIVVRIVVRERWGGGA